MENWHKITIEESIKALETNFSVGLTEEEARKRLFDYGPNVIESKKKTPAFIVFLEQFNDIFIWILIAAAFYSGFIEKNIVDAIVIGIVLILNALLGYTQTSKAEKALEALKDLTAPTATVIRNKEVEIKSECLVPGDIILLEAGDKIPADARLIHVASLQTLEASLTGESSPVNKKIGTLDPKILAISEQNNMIFAGTSVSRGRAKALVVATGSNTEMGKIAELIDVDKEPTPLQKEQKKLGKIIAIAMLFIAILVIMVGVLKGNSITSMGLTAIALAVAAIPEGLPAIVTITLAIGMQYMARQNAIIKRLHAVETLGSTNFIVSDKTGTLTLNEMTAVKLFCDSRLFSISEGKLFSDEKEHKPDSFSKLMKVAVLANDSRKQVDSDSYVGEPTELALVNLGTKFGFFNENLVEQYKRLSELPFESERKEMTTVHKFNPSIVLEDKSNLVDKQEENKSFMAFTKGACEVLLQQSTRILDNNQMRTLSGSERKNLLDIANKLAAEGYRVLGFAYNEFSVLPKLEELEKDLVFVGMIGLLDPPRPEVAEAIRVAKSAGIKIAMVTGDHLLTATKIAHEIGLDQGKKSITGAEIEQLSAHQLAAIVEDISIFARVDPIHKVKIVEALKEKGYIVAVTGDGVNDAPALKKADIGIAMGITGTDVSKEAASMVLADDNFATIIKAITRGRMIFENIQKFISYLLSANASQVLTIFLGILIFPAGTQLLLPIQILWINLVTDAFPALALGVDPPSRNIMHRSPRGNGESIITKKQLFRILAEGAVLTTAALTVFYIEFTELGNSMATAQTMVFTTLVFTKLIHAFSYRSNNSIFSAETFKNHWLLAAFSGSLILQLSVIYIPFMQPYFKTSPLGLNDWLVIFVAAFAAEIIIDFIKTVFFKPRKSYVEVSQN